MLRLRQRLRKLERSPMLPRLPDSGNPAVGPALRQISDEDLALLRKIVSDREAGVGRPFAERVSSDRGVRALANVKEGE
jgi:hypothetical protein